MSLSTAYKVGEPIQVRDNNLFPISKVTVAARQGVPAGLIWNRPHTVFVQDGQGREQVLRIRDATRERQLYLLGLGVLGALMLWMISKR